jgi:sec-independent protein translocase protein TatA
MKNFGAAEILLISLIIIFLFGGKKIPEFIRGLGEAIKEFKKSTSR